jgi:predicted mannosyl-3-phosphoglycerate phosphatase (HAD superfamily)
MKLELNQSELTLIKEALTDLQSQLVGVDAEPAGLTAYHKQHEIIGILNKVSDKPKVKKKLSNKEYMFTFEEGGWNTVWAKTKKGAIKAALKEYKSSDGLTVRVGSVHKSTPSGLKSAMSLFY